MPESVRRARGLLGRRRPGPGRLAVVGLSLACVGALASPVAAIEPRSGDIGISGRMEDPGIYTMRADGSRLHRILEGGWGAAWSPRGTRIAFSMTGPQGTNLYLVRADGTHLRRLTDERPTRHASYDPTWSPDGTRIAFTSHGRGLRSHIWIITIATRRIERFTRSRALDSSPDWSPDGSTVAFTSTRAYAPDSSGNYDVWLKDIRTGVLTRLTRASASDGDPSWSPDGSKIAFVSDRGSGRRRIWVRDLHGSTRLLSRAGRGDEFAPDWSPNGRHIVFVRQSRRLTSGIRRIDVGTRRVRELIPSKERFYGWPCWRAG